MTKQELAITLHNKGYNCSQSVVCAFHEELGIDETTLFKACEGFGLGMGCMNGTCGALSGAVMAAGFVTSTANLEGEKSKIQTYQCAKQMVDDFQAKNASIICSELKGIGTGKILRSCEGCIQDGVTLVEKYLAK